MVKMVVVLFYSVFVLFAHVAETSQAICLLSDNIALESCCSGEDADSSLPADESKDASAVDPCLDCLFCKAPTSPSAIYLPHSASITMADQGYQMMDVDKIVSDDCIHSLLRPPRA